MVVTHLFTNYSWCKHPSREKGREHPSSSLLCATGMWNDCRGLKRFSIRLGCVTLIMFLHKYMKCCWEITVNENESKTERKPLPPARRKILPFKKQDLTKASVGIVKVVWRSAWLLGTFQLLKKGEWTSSACSSVILSACAHACLFWAKSWLWGHRPGFEICSPIPSLTLGKLQLLGKELVDCSLHYMKHA